VLILTQKNCVFQNKRHSMKFKHFFLMSALVSPISQAMHFENGSTRLQFDGKEKTIRDWIRDDRNENFGKTTVITTTTNKHPFEKSGSVRTLTPAEFQLICTGYSFYCSNLKNKNNITYGAIIINPHQHHFDKKAARNMCEHIKNTYVEKQLEKDSRSRILLEPDTTL
jgi:hypothetical protein